jgi:hypothetical protein
VRATLSLLGLLALAGCKKKAEVDCGAAGRAWAELAHRQLVSDGDAERSEKANAVLPALREALVKRCTDEKWDVATRRCVAEADTAAALEKCAPTPPAP